MTVWLPTATVRNIIEGLTDDLPLLGVMRMLAEEVLEYRLMRVAWQPCFCPYCRGEQRPC